MKGPETKKKIRNITDEEFDVDTPYEVYIEMIGYEPDDKEENKNIIIDNNHTQDDIPPEEDEPRIHDDYCIDEDEPYSEIMGTFSEFQD